MKKMKDITNSGGPNTAMRVMAIIREAGLCER